MQGRPRFRLLLSVAQTVQVLPGRIAMCRRRQIVEPGTVHRRRVPGRRAPEDGDRRGGRPRPEHAGRQSDFSDRLPGRGAGSGPAQSRVAVPQPLAVDSRSRQTAPGRVQRTGTQNVPGGPGRPRLLRAPHNQVPAHTAAGQGTGIRYQRAVLRQPADRHGVQGALQPDGRLLFRGPRPLVVLYCFVGPSAISRRFRFAAADQQLRFPAGARVEYVGKHRMTNDVASSFCQKYYIIAM